MAKTSLFYFYSSSGFGQKWYTVRARDLDHAARIVTTRAHGRTAKVRDNRNGSFTIFSKDGYDLTSFRQVSVEEVPA